jgi:hypothetical protein
VHKLEDEWKVLKQEYDKMPFMPHNPKQMAFKKVKQKRAEHDSAEKEYNLMFKSYEERPEEVDARKVEAQVVGAYKAKNKTAP